MCYSIWGIVLIASCVLDCTAGTYWYNREFKWPNQWPNQWPKNEVRITQQNAWSEQLQKEITQSLQNLQSGVNNLGTFTYNQKPCTPGNFESRFDEIEDRLSKIERLISQTNGDMARVVENQLDAGLDRIMEKMAEVGDRLQNTLPAAIPTPEISGGEFSLQLSATEDRLAEKINLMELKMDRMALMNAQEPSSQTENSKAVLKTVMDISAGLKDVKNAVNEVRLAADVRTDKSETILKNQQSTLNDVKKVLTNTENLVRNISTLHDDMILHNQTRAVLREAEHALEVRVNRTISGMMSQVTANEKEVKKSIEALRSDPVSKTDCDDVNNKLHNIADTQVVTVSAIAEVLNATNKVVVEVRQKLSEFGAMINNQTAVGKETFDGIAEAIMNNHSEALANSEITIIHELHQVMNPINVIQQQITVTAKKMKELYDQNEAHLNSSASALSAIESQVSDTKEREREIDSNLKSLLVRIPVVTQEFDHVKMGLDAVLDNVKTSLKEMQNKTNEILNHPLPCSIADIDTTGLFNTSAH